MKNIKKIAVVFSLVVALCAGGQALAARQYEAGDVLVNDVGTVLTVESVNEDGSIVAFMGDEQVYQIWYPQELLDAGFKEVQMVEANGKKGGKTTYQVGDLLINNFGTVLIVETVNGDSISTVTQEGGIYQVWTARELKRAGYNVL